MRVEPLSFRHDPARFTALYIRDHGFDPQHTLIITPTARFKIYMAQAFLEMSGTQDSIVPRMMRANELANALTSMSGFSHANRMQKLTLLYSACRETAGFRGLFGEEVLSGFSSFQRFASGLLGLFDELNRMEIDPGSVTPERYYRNFDEHFGVIRELFERYGEQQRKRRLYDETFLLKKVKKEDIDAFFSGYGDVLLISPLLLTAFEKRVFAAVEEKLHVILQDTDDHDFSRLLSFHPGEDGPKPASPEGEGSLIEIHEASTRIETVTLLLSVLRNEIERGVKPHEIAVVNIDPRVCEALKRSCDALGVRSNYTRGIPIRKAPVYTFLRLAGAFFDSGLDSDILLELLRHEFFGELRVHGDSTGLTEFTELKRKVAAKRVFSLESIKSDLLDRESRGALEFLLTLHRAKDFKELYKSLLELFRKFDGRRPFEFYTVRDMLLESAIELSELNIGTLKFKDSAIEFMKLDSSKFGLVESKLHESKLPVSEHVVLTPQESPFNIFLQYAGGKRYPVKGSMRQGVQILGLLETRGVRFRTIMVPTFNEGYFPTSPGHDLIYSSDLRRALGLSTLADREKLEYYYMKRLIDASEKAFLIPIRDTTGDFEIPSRFCQIMKAEKGEHLSRTLPVQEKGRAAPKEREIYPLLSVKSDSYSRLDIHRLKRCEVQYYIARILKIEGERVLTRSIEIDLVGAIVHGLLHDLYRNLDFKSLPSRRDFDERVRKLFLDRFSPGLFGTHEEVLYKRILLENITESLGRDYERFIKGSAVCSEWLEKDFNARLGRYTFSGRIDRIDRSKEGGYLILDYKTGRLPAPREHKPEGGYVEVQLGFYGLLFRKSFPDLPIIGLGYFDLSRRRDIEIVVDCTEVSRYLDGFETHLIRFLDEFGDKERLSPASDRNVCAHCPYYAICRVYES
jgi:hypothetical protein